MPSLPWTTAASVAVGIGVGYLLTRRTWRRRDSQSPLASCQAPLGRAHVFTLSTIVRDERRAPRRHILPSAQIWLTVEAGTAPEEVAATDLFVDDSEYVLYSVEGIASDAPFLVFLSLPRDKREQLVRKEPFIDRGIRKLVDEGSRVAVMSLASAEQALETATSHDLSPADAKLSFVWNTGRCGSTLLHKAIGALGAISFSEPYWLECMCFHRPPLKSPAEQKALRRAVAACVGAEVRLARAQRQLSGWSSTTTFAFNPKAQGHEFVAPAVADALPHARHAFMYRACHQVVESFAGLIFSSGVSWSMWLMWRLQGLRAMPGPPITDEKMRAALRALSSLPVAMLTNKWLGNVRGWVNLVAQREKGRSGPDPIADAIALRYDEFASADAPTRAAVVRDTLLHLGALGAGADDAALAAALSVFGTHSQSGSAMAGPKVKVVMPADVPLVQQAAALGLAPLASWGVVVQDGGANVLLPRSLGAV